MSPHSIHSHFFFFNDTATTEIYTLSLHDALPILLPARLRVPGREPERQHPPERVVIEQRQAQRSEEHTSELQSRLHLVCRLLLEKKKTAQNPTPVLPNSVRRAVR